MSTRIAENVEVRYRRGCTAGSSDCCSSTPGGHSDCHILVTCLHGWIVSVVAGQSHIIRSRAGRCIWRIDVDLVLAGVSFIVINPTWQLVLVD